MKITDAWVDDPMQSGITEHPKLCIEVDEMPDVSIPPQDFSGSWTVGKFGPFIRYSCSTHKVDAGDFNVRFRGRFPAIVDISLFLKDQDESASEDYAINLTRGRQLLKKWSNSWRLLLSDREGQNGRLIWRPVESNPLCRFYNLGLACSKPAVTSVWMKGVEVPLCANHLKSYNEKHASLRATSSK